MRHAAAAAALAGSLLLLPPPAEANLVRGVKRIVAGALQVPISTLVGTVTGPPIVGTVMGAANGVVQGVGLIAGGAVDLASAGIAIAKKVGPFLLPFLL